LRQIDQFAHTSVTFSAIYLRLSNCLAAQFAATVSLTDDRDGVRLSGTSARMQDQAKPESDSIPQSLHAQQLARGFPWLRFEPTLEQEFRQRFRTDSLVLNRRNLWIAVAFMLGFSLLTHLILDAGVNRTVEAISFAILVPILGLGLAVTYSKRHQRWFPVVCQICAPIFGIGIVAIAVIAAQQGLNLISTVVLVTIYIYFMLGMLFYSALCSAIAVLAAYVLAAAFAGLPWPAMLIDVGVLLFTNVVGMMVGYTLERATRTNFLEERLLIELASRDALTGMHNRRVFDEHLQRVWPQASREKVPMALLLIDIDHFKAYNDHYGHQAGDQCLRQVAWCLMQSARRPLDVTARYGGEEFAIVLYDARSEYVQELVRRIQASIAALAIQHQASPSGTHITFSIGVACVEPSGGRSYRGFIQLADEALYAAKERGRNCSVTLGMSEYAALSTGSFRKSAAVPRP
jgi:diguanylate cyclase (GGDEF)-like protein